MHSVRPITIDDAAQYLELCHRLDQETSFMLYEPGERTTGRLRRNHRTVCLVVGILQQFAGQGIGTALFQAMEGWAGKVGAHRLELTVMTHNTAAIALYRKMGFEVEGTAGDTLFVDGRYV